MHFLRRENLSLVDFARLKSIWHILEHEGNSRLEDANRIATSNVVGSERGGRLARFTCEVLIPVTAARPLGG